MLSQVTGVVLPNGLLQGHTKVASAGTAVALTASSALISGVNIKALSGNAGLIFVGSSTVVNASGTEALRGYELNAKESVFIEVDDISKVFINAATTNDAVSWLAS
jgi:hypothetical protein